MDMSFGSFAAVVWRVAKLVPRFEVFLIARRAVCDVFPALVTFESAEFGCAPRKF